MAHEAEIIEQFRRAMSDQGIVVHGEIEADGKFHRVHVDGDRGRSRNGWYVLHIDGTRPAGAFGCNKRYGNEAKFTWSGETKPLTPEERREWARKMAKQAAEREAEKRKRREDAAHHARFMWEQAQPCKGDDHPYLKRKGVKSHGLRVGAWEKIDRENGEVETISTQALLVPIRDAKKNIHSLQAIFTGKVYGDRDKDFVKDGAKEGLFYSMGKPKTVEFEGRQRKLIMIGEGYATVSTAHEVTDHAGITAFDAGNMLPVARALRKVFPDALFLFLADNDRFTLTPIENPGVHHARIAAKEVGGLVAIPQFPVDATGKPTDFNDLRALSGDDAVRDAIEAALKPPAAPAEPAPVEDPAPWEGDEEPPLAAPLPGPAPSAEDDDKTPARNSHFAILGYNRGTYYVFQFGKRQIVELKKGDLGTTGLIELATLNWWEMEFPGQRSAAIDINAAAEFIIRTAEKRGIFDTEKIRGRGAWIDEGRVVYHHGSHLSVNGEHVDVTKIKSRYVYEMDKSLQMPHDQMLTDEEGKRIIDVMKMFRWSVSGSALLFAGWIALAPICGAIPWRPHVWMTGGAGSGKSSLAKFAHSLLKGTDVFAQGNSTEPGIRQRLRSDARPVIMDESESNEEGDARRVQSILGLIRQASTESDAETLKGTTDGGGMTYHIRSMFCLASIQVALKHKADIDRLTVLTLKSGTPGDTAASGEWSKMKEAMYQLTGREDSTVRARLLRRSIDLLPTTLQNIEVFSSVGAEVFGSQRDGDQYGALLAGAWSLMSTGVATRQQARAMFDAYNWHELRDNHDTDESQRALGALMEAHIRIKGGGELTVFELVCAASGRQSQLAEVTESSADALLQRHGMRVKDGWLVLANNSNELKRLMVGTTFEADYRGVLLRLEGADKNGNAPMKFSGVQSKCIRIPLGPIVGDLALRADEPAF